MLEVAFGQARTVLDALYASGRVTHGRRRLLALATDAPRAARAPAAMLRAADDVMVAVHKLEWALCLGDASKQQRIRDEIEALAGRWPALDLKRA